MYTNRKPRSDGAQERARSTTPLLVAEGVISTFFGGIHMGRCDYIQYN